ncbi:uncharacterized protein LACBIDRAFT_335805 [Laccaria bicolor S238N-H82]|uniref:Predicted protein n=1 Tax=Laccaria bicolor (strain S238N-H82 / ATCC MYA-4686) TaxID=486041 RepID=B0E3G6_LACBS|nr:uncharacterized protein LACBIDRAFT_335805 [Laccaria bicolor S238N-H82]EDQ98614.1 predicted protein [Laccaria bicolor S238N-H82]|eukprot:XP_001890733.1 predicted protein [Laccaria bicolor S238N-H82]
MQQSFTPPPVERTSRPEGSRSVSRSRQVSPPDPKEVHLDTALYQKKIDFRSLSPPPNFDMQTMQQEIRRLAHGQADLLQKLRDQQAQVSVMESSTPTMREYSAFVVRKQDIDASALLPPAVDSPVTLSQRLLALEEITRCIQDQDLASRPLSEKIASLETSVWFQEEKITGATRRMDHIEESAHMRWKETQEDLQSIRSDHQRLEAEVREAVKTLENKWETTPAALQESLTRGFEKLACTSPKRVLMAGPPLMGSTDPWAHQQAPSTMDGSDDDGEDLDVEKPTKKPTKQHDEHHEDGSDDSDSDSDNGQERPKQDTLTKPTVKPSRVNPTLEKDRDSGSDLGSDDAMITVDTSPELQPRYNDTQALSHEVPSDTEVLADDTFWEADLGCGVESADRVKKRKFTDEEDTPCKFPRLEKGKVKCRAASAVIQATVKPAQATNLRSDTTKALNSFDFTKSSGVNAKRPVPSKQKESEAGPSQQPSIDVPTKPKPKPRPIMKGKVSTGELGIVT